MPGFDNENTEDNVCPTLQGSNKFEIWKNLLDLALGDVVYSNWERSAVTAPANDVPDIELPSHTTDDVSDYWRIDYLQSKLLADARLYWWLNRDQILEDLPNRASGVDAVTPELVEKLTHMGDKTFGDPRNAGIHNDPVALLLSNKTYTCSTGNPTRVISVEEDIEMTTDSGTQTLRPGIACEFGSPFPDGTFNDLSICGPNDILCKGQEPTPNPQCFRRCNCDAWPPPYQDVFEDEGVKYFRKWNGFRFTVGDSRTSSQINNIRNSDYRVCSTNDYFGGTVPRPKDFCDESGCNGCTPECNCNLVCSMAQAGGRYANCFADGGEYGSGLSSDIEVAEFCVDDGQCSSIQQCDTTNKACVTDPCFLRFGGGASPEKCVDPTFVESVLAACDGGDVPTCDSQCCAKVLSDYMQTCKCAALSNRNTFGKLLELDQHVCSGLTGRRPTCGH